MSRDAPDHLRFDVGTYLDVKDNMGKWLEGVVVLHDERRGLVGVHYLGWPDKWDETLNLREHRERFAPLHQYSSWTKNAPFPPSEDEQRSMAHEAAHAANAYRAGDKVVVRPDRIALTATVLAVDGAQLHVQHDPAVAPRRPATARATPAPRLPVWFHTVLDEIENTTRKPLPPPRAAAPAASSTTNKPLLSLDDEMPVAARAASAVSAASRSTRPSELALAAGYTSAAASPSAASYSRTPSALAPALAPANRPMSSDYRPSPVAVSSPSAYGLPSRQMSRLSVRGPPPPSFAVGATVDVRSIEDGLWNAATVVANPGDLDAEVTVRFMDRDTTQEVAAIDIPFVLAPHGKFTSGTLLEEWQLGDVVDVVIDTPQENHKLRGDVQQFKAGQMLVRDTASEEVYWVHPKHDRVTMWRPVSARSASYAPASYLPASRRVVAPAPSSYVSSVVRSPSASYASMLANPPPARPKPAPAPIDLTTPSPSSRAASSASHYLPLSSSSYVSTPSPRSVAPVSPMPFALNDSLDKPFAPPAERDRTVLHSGAFYASLLRRSVLSPLRKGVGVVNLGNSCYIGGALQCLAGLRPLIQYFVLDRTHLAALEAHAQLHKVALANASASERVDPLPRNFGALTMEFARILHELYHGPQRDSRIFPDELKRLIVRLPNDGGARFGGAAMQDSHEFLAVLLNALHSELNTGVKEVIKPAEEQKQSSAAEIPAVSPRDAAIAHWLQFSLSNNDPLNALFYFQSAQYVVCSSCKHPSISHHVHGQLTLDIPRASPLSPSAGAFSYRSAATPRPSVTLKQCLATATTVDSLEDYMCSRCRKKHPATTSMYYTSLPPVLLIQLKRFEMGMIGGRKNETPCDYPMELDASSLLQPHPQLLAALEQDPFVATSASIHTRYRLAGLLLHHAHHYTAFTQVRSRRAGEAEWCFFNDSKATGETEADVLSQQRHAYLFVYQRVEE